MTSSNIVLRIWWRILFVDHLTPIRRKFLIIISIDVAGMGQRWRTFDSKWYEMGVMAKMGVNYVTDFFFSSFYFLFLFFLSPSLFFSFFFFLFFLFSTNYFSPFFHSPVRPFSSLPYTHSLTQPTNQPTNQHCTYIHIGTHKIPWLHPTDQHPKPPAQIKSAKNKRFNEIKI